MVITNTWRRLASAILAGLAVALIAVATPIAIGALTPIYAQVSDEFQDALGPYGEWRQDPRFGDVWVPTSLPPDWRPYQYGHWVYTDEWGWYWVSDDTEADWGWVTYHYGRWAFDRGSGWFWVPGDEWAPAWVDWRYSDEYVGWAPLPPDDLVDAYEAEPAYWVFVPGRYMTAPRLRSYFVPRERRVSVLRGTRVVNRTLAVRGARLAVNPGISPAFIARVTHAPVTTFRVRPRVFASTQGVSGAVQVRREELRGGRPGGGPSGPGGASAPRGSLGAISVQRTTTLIQPGVGVAAPQALGKDERGRLGTHPPRAAQGGAAPQQQQQQQGPAGAPATPPSPPPAIAPPRQEPSRSAPLEERRPPTGNQPAIRQGEPPQAKPERPITPQTPPPPPPAQLQPRQQPPPPAVAHPAPPPPPPPPVAHPAPPPPPPPPVAHPPPPPPHPAAPPPPPAARPAPPPPPAAKPAAPPKPGEKPPEPPK